MSSFISQKITFPNCNQEDNFTIWQSVNVDLDPNMKSKVLDGSLFKWTCPNSGETFTVPYPFLYHDMTNNFMVQFNGNTPTVLMAEYIHIKDSQLDEKVLEKIKEEYRCQHERKNILFEKVVDDSYLQFAVYEMPDKLWEPTERKYQLPISVYKSIDPS